MKRFLIIALALAALFLAAPARACDYGAASISSYSSYSSYSLVTPTVSQIVVSAPQQFVYSQPLTFGYGVQSIVSDYSTGLDGLEVQAVRRGVRSAVIVGGRRNAVIVGGRRAVVVRQRAAVVVGRRAVIVGGRARIRVR